MILDLNEQPLEDAVLTRINNNRTYSYLQYWTAFRAISMSTSPDLSTHIDCRLKTLVGHRQQHWP